MTLGTPEIVVEFDPGGLNEDYPEQPEAYGTSLLVPTWDFNIYLVDPSAGTKTLWNGTAADRDPGAIHSDGSFLQAGAKYSADGTTYDDTFLLDTGPDWSRSGSYIDLGVDHLGRIWGMSDQRAIWAWNDDGTIWREFNGSAIPGTTIPDGPRAVTFHGGLMFVASYDGIWVTDPYDSANIVDTWPARTPSDYPSEYELHFTRLVDIDTGAFDDGHLVRTYAGGIAVDGERVYFTDIGESTTPTPSRILSCASTGTNQTPTVEYIGNATDFTDDTFTLTGLNVIDGYLYAAGWGASRLYRWALTTPTLLGPTVGFIGPGKFMG